MSRMLADFVCCAFWLMEDILATYMSV